MKIVPFGCSHMADIVESCRINYGAHWINENIKITDGFFGGNSNQKIIEDVYRFVNGYNLDNKIFNDRGDVVKHQPKKYEQNDVLYIQFTYTNRLWLPSNLKANSSSFHSMGLNGGVLYLNNKNFQKELLTFYKLYIKYFWNYHLNLLDLLQKVDMLQVYLKSKNIKFVSSFWTFGSHVPEYQEVLDSMLEFSERDINPIKEQIEDIKSRLEYLNKDESHTIKDWVTSNTTSYNLKDIYRDDGVHYAQPISLKIFDELIYPACKSKITS